MVTSRLIAAGGATKGCLFQFGCRMLRTMLQLMRRPKTNTPCVVKSRRRCEGVKFQKSVLRRTCFRAGSISEVTVSGTAQWWLSRERGGCRTGPLMWSSH